MYYSNATGGELYNLFTNMIQNLRKKGEKELLRVPKELSAVSTLVRRNCLRLSIISLLRVNNMPFRSGGQRECVNKACSVLRQVWGEIAGTFFGETPFTTAAFDGDLASIAKMYILAHAGDTPEPLCRLRTEKNGFGSAAEPDLRKSSAGNKAAPYDTN